MEAIFSKALKHLSKDPIFKSNNSSFFWESKNLHESHLIEYQLLIIESNFSLNPF